MPNAVLDVFATPHIRMERRDDGAVVLRGDELGDFAPSLAHVLRDHAVEHPERPLATQAGGDGRTVLTWGDARARADAVAQSLLDHGLGPERPLLILSGNSLEHLVLMLGAYTAGVPTVSVSTAYSLLSSDHARLRGIVELSTPGMLFADDADAYGGALDAMRETVPVHVVSRGAGARADTLRLDELLAATPGVEVDRAVSALGPDTVAKIGYTSGSTGLPKGVITTHRMLCSNQQALGQIWPFLAHEPPVLVDWLPWSHTFGGNHNLGQMLAFGGTLHIDDGKPAPGLFERTLSALREHPPTVYYNVPAGYALLVPRLEQDRELAERFFSRLRFMFYAGAALPQDLWDRLRSLAHEVAGRDIPLTASWGLTETAPAATSAHFAGSRCGCIGVPLPGVTLKLVPEGDKLEIRLKGPNVTPGYHRNPEATAAAFDEEGFLRTGDAVRLVDPDDANQGLMFDGRLAEDFKLTSGTWVTVGRVRTALVSAAAGVLTDAVIAGHDGAYVAALAWVNQAEAKRVCDVHGDVSLDDPQLRQHLARALARLNAGAGSASRIERLLLLAEPPSLDAGEITDKGYLNQRRVLQRRAAEVARLLDEPVDPTVILPGVVEVAD
jgi:feruloyl-CoA synthase